MDPLSFKCWISFDSFCCLFFLMGCDHVTALLILMSAYIFPASCLHFRTSLRSITANRWVHLWHSQYTVWSFVGPRGFNQTSFMCFMSCLEHFVQRVGWIDLCVVFAWMCYRFKPSSHRILSWLVFRGVCHIHCRVGDLIKLTFAH